MSEKEKALGEVLALAIKLNHELAGERLRLRQSIRLMRSCVEKGFHDDAIKVAAEAIGDE